MMRIAICAVVLICSIFLTHHVARSEPPHPAAMPSGNIATQNPEQTPEPESELPRIDAEAQAAEQSPEAESELPMVDAEAQTAEQSPGAEPEVPSVDTETQTAEQSPGAEPEVPSVDAEAQTAEQSPGAEPDVPTVDDEAQAVEQGPGAGLVSPANGSAPPVSEPALDGEAPLPPSEAVISTSNPIPNEEADPPAIGKTSVIKALFNNLEMEFTLSAGLRKDDFQWSKAGNSAGSNPNILSELTWSDVDSYQLTLTNRSLYKRHFYFRGDVSYAFIQNGRIQDSDYREDHRRNEYSRSISDSSGDQIWDVSLAGGYPFFFLEEQLLVVPLFGISYHKQNLRITDGEQVITSPTVHPLGTINGLDSTYRTTWYGPWIGCDLRYRLGDDRGVDTLPMEFGLSFELHYADYKAEANWNLRDDLQHPVSFEHEADGYGVALAGEWLIGLGEQWDFVFRTTYQYWLTEDGVDRAKKSDGTVDRSRLNEVAWHNHSMMVGVNFHF